MQPMPAKTRTAVLAGAALLAVVVGAFAFWSTRNNAPKTPDDDFALYDDLANPTPAPGSSAGTLPLTVESVTPTPGGHSPAASVATAPTATVPDVHVVAVGESLSAISRRYYGTPIYAGDIEAVNELDDPDFLVVGQSLKLPRPEVLQSAGN